MCWRDWQRRRRWVLLPDMLCSIARCPRAERSISRSSFARPDNRRAAVCRGPKRHPHLVVKTLDVERPPALSPVRVYIPTPDSEYLPPQILDPISEDRRVGKEWVKTCRCRG